MKISNGPFRDVRVGNFQVSTGELQMTFEKEPLRGKVINFHVIAYSWRNKNAPAPNFHSLN